MMTQRCDRTGRDGRWFRGRLDRPVILVLFTFGSFLSFSTLAAATTYYADNAFGDAGFDGLSAVVTNGHGPKRHIADAIATASSGDQIAVAAGFYQESLWDPRAKIVTLLPSNVVTIVGNDPGQLDSDSDNIPDWWMLKYFGHNTGSVSDQSCATCDYNGNGVDNLHEFLNGWDPTNTCVAPVLYTANYQTNIVCSAIDWPGDFIVGSNTSSDVLLIQGGILSSTGDSYLGYESNSSNNTVVVDGPGSVWSNNVIYFAFSGCGNSLVITNGGQVTGQTAWAEYNPGSSNNAVLITDTGSVWNVAGDLTFNDSGNHLTIQNGGLLVAGTSWFGFTGGSSNNTALVTGSGSVWSNTSDLYITGDGGQSLVISNGGLVTDADAFLANPSSTASNNSALVTGPGSLWITADLSVGGGDMDFLGGSNRLVISDGGQLKISGSLDIGGDNVGFDSLVISNGGQVTSGVATLGAAEGNSNTVLVAGPDAVWNISGDLTIGASAGGNSLVISNGGSVVDNRGLLGDDCWDPLPDNTVLVTGPGSVWNNLSDLYIGAPDKYYCNAALLISNSATVYATSMVIGFAAVNTMNPVTINGGNLIVANAAENGLLDISGGTLTVNDGLCRTDHLIMRNGHFSTLVYNGGSITAGTADIENGAVLDITIGPNSSPIAVSGDLTLNAVLNLTDAGAPAGGPYTLFTYSGTLNYMELGVGGGAPCGDLPTAGEVITNAAYSVDISVPGQVNLVNTGVELTRTSEGAVSLRWNSQSNAIYRLECTDSTSTDTVWTLMQDNYPSQGTNTIWLDTGNYLQNPAIQHPKYATDRCYRVDYLGTNSVTPPSVNVVSPANGAILSGVVTVTVAAASSTVPYLNSYLYVDGQRMHYSDDGSNFAINTCEWPNGPHILFATAKGQSQLDGLSELLPIDAAYAASPYVPVTFSNFISQVAFSQQFFEPALGQIQQVTATFGANASWTLQIQDQHGNTARNASGSGSSMTFNWDGTGNGGSGIQVGVYYFAISAQASGGSSSETTTAPTRPPTAPGKGSLGTFGVARWDFSEYPNAFPTPYNGVDGQVQIDCRFEVPRFAAYGAENSADYFVDVMTEGRWKLGFNCSGRSGFRANDMRAAKWGGNEMFGTVNLGLFLGHGLNGTSVDYNPDAGGTYMTYLTSDNAADDNMPYTSPWVRLSECGFGGNLRWMGLAACRMLTDGPNDPECQYDGDNFLSMWDAGVLPIPDSLHLLCGMETDFVGNDFFGGLWAAYMVGASDRAPETIRKAWCDAEWTVCVMSGIDDTILCLVVGSDNCLDDTLADIDKGPSGTLTFDYCYAHQ
jgi:T5SS/PEP-CTERM-associated repeat protein